MSNKEEFEVDEIEVNVGEEKEEDIPLPGEEEEEDISIQTLLDDVEIQEMYAMLSNACNLPNAHCTDKRWKCIFDYVLGKSETFNEIEYEKSKSNEDDGESHFLQHFMIKFKKNRMLS